MCLFFAVRPCAKALANNIPMKKYIVILSLFIHLTLFAQEKIAKLSYANIEISVPEKCSTTSVFEVLDCNGFSVQWLYLSEEMVQQKVDVLFQSQIEEQFAYKKKESIVFSSQNQPFTGTKYKMKNGSIRIIGFGRVNKIPLLLNLGFEKDPKNNTNLTEFEKNFIHFD